MFYFASVIPYNAAESTNAAATLSNVNIHFILFYFQQDFKMNALSKSEVLRLVRHINDKKFVPYILLGTRQTKQNLIRKLRRYWSSQASRSHLLLSPKVKVPAFQFCFETRSWNFELPHTNFLYFLS